MGSETTADGTITDLMTYELGADQSVKLVVKVLAQRYDSGESDEVYTYSAIHLFNKAGAAGAVLRGGSTPVEVDPQTTGWTVTVDADVNNARVRVTGTASEDVRWIGNITALQVEQEVLGTFSQLSSTLNGTDELVAMGNVAELSFDRLDPLSISLWVKTTSGGSLITKWAGLAPIGMVFGVGTSLAFGFVNTWASNSLYVQAVAGVTDGKWHHVVVTYSGSSAASGVEFYVDGTILTKSAPNHDNLVSTTINTEPFKIGGYTSGAPSYYVGQVDDVAVYDKALSQAEVADLFSLVQPADNRLLSTASNMVGYWLMGDGDTSPTIVDRSASGNDGTTTNMDASNFTADVPVNGEVAGDYAPLTTSLLLPGVAGDGKYVTYPATPSAQPERNDPFTASIWFKTSSASDDTLFGSYSTSTGWCFFVPLGTNNIGFTGPRAALQSLDTVSATAGGAPNVRDGNWHQVVAVSDGNSPLTSSDIHIYIDGVEMTGAKKTGTGSVTTTTVLPTAKVVVGNVQGGVAEFPGNLCHAAAWNFAMTAAQVTELYGGGVPQNLRAMSFVNPVFWATLGDGAAVGAGNMIERGVSGTDGTTEAPVVAGDFVADVPP
ncbi:MAG: laminin G domain-containing protein [Deltaproteobacteria bacterium]|nr:laminin G domain-containing protein [Deltaproteobacteria bacterium]